MFFFILFNVDFFELSDFINLNDEIKTLKIIKIIKIEKPVINVFFISKCGIMYPSKKLPIKTKHYDYSEDHIIKSVNNSLKYLQTDYLDCLLLHRPSPLMDISIVTDTINSLIKSGKIKGFGVSNFTTSQMEMFKGKVEILYNQISPLALKRKFSYLNLIC